VIEDDTIQSIKLFQQKNGLKVDGKAGKATMEKLGV
jgi:murein L,D-transpeptidase YcbB/YkuD